MIIFVKLSSNQGFLWEVRIGKSSRNLTFFDLHVLISEKGIILWPLSKIEQSTHTCILNLSIIWYLIWQFLVTDLIRFAVLSLPLVWHSNTGLLPEGNRLYNRLSIARGLPIIDSKFTVDIQHLCYQCFQNSAVFISVVKSCM